MDEAENTFRKVESIQKQRQPEYNLLYSAQGFYFCDLLLSQGQVAEVLQRYEKFLEWRQPSDSLLSIALEHLSAGRAHLLLALSATTGLALSSVEGQSFAQADDFLNQAVAGLREAGTQHHIPRALFARAALYRVQGEFAKAWADLDEAHEITERAGMGLHLADYHLETCRLCLKEFVGAHRCAPQLEKAKEHLEQAATMITKMGYSRRQPEVEALRQAWQMKKSTNGRCQKFCPEGTNDNSPPIYWWK